MRVLIFADHRTKRRVAAKVGLIEEARGLMTNLNEKLGGNWVLVQELKPYEVIPFDAVNEYHGFDNNPSEDYCGNIINLKNYIICNETQA